MIAALVTTEEFEDDYEVSYRQVERSQVNHKQSSKSKWNTQRRYKRRTSNDAVLSNGSHQRRQRRNCA